MLNIEKEKERQKGGEGGYKTEEGPGKVIQATRLGKGGGALVRFIILFNPIHIH
jgi:hypothetical protein